MKNNLFSTLVVNKNFFKKSLFLVLACCLSYSALGATIYSTDIVESPSGATIAGNKGEFTSAPSWASECSNCFKTTGSAGAITITFDEPLNLSGYNNCQLILTWGAESNRPVNVSVNEGAASEIDKVSSSAERSTVRNAKMDLAVNSISSIKISGSGGGQSYYFHIEIISDGESSGGGDTPGEDPQDEGEPFVQSFSFDNMVAGSDVYDEDNLAIKAKIKFGSDRTNIKPTFKGKNISDNWTPVSADFEANETNTFTFQYTKSGKVKNYEVTITEAPKEEPGEAKYISSLFFEQIVLDEGVNYDIEGALTAHNYNFENINSLDSLNDEKDLRNEPYLGLKIKKSGGYISGTLKGGSTVRVKFGYVAEVVNVSVNNSSQALEPIDNRLDNLEFTAPEDVHIKISTTSDKTVVLKQIAIDEDIRDVTLPESPSSDPVAVSNVLISKETLSLEVGQSETITATIVPSDATNKKVTWESSDDAVATVSNGKVTAVAEGTATITVKTDDGGFTATCEVTVTKKETPIDPPSGDIYAHWRFSGSDAPANSTFEDGTNIRVEFLSSDDSKSFTVESADYVAGVPDDMKSQGSKGLKNGGNKLYLKASTTNGEGFKAGDVITICGYNPWKISSTSEHTGDISASLATGASKTEYNIGSVTLAADSKDLFLMRAEGTGTCICALKVTRGGETPPVDDPVAVTGIKIDNSKLSVEEGSTVQISASVLPSNATNKNLSYESDDTSVATVDKNGKVTGVSEGTANITVTTEDGGFTGNCEITVTKKSEDPDPELPDVGLTAHVPDIYDDPLGYKTPLSVFNGYEYEVYYVTRDVTGSNIAIDTKPTDKTTGITTGEEKSVKAKDNWFEMKDCNGTGGDSNAGAKDEFKENSLRSIKFRGGNEMLFQVKGFDQFSFYGKDNNKDASKGKQFEVYIDDKKVSGDPIDGYAIHRYDMSTKEHVIKLVGIGDGDSKLTGFSLRVAQEPRVKYFDGNDTTQKVLQTSDIKPIVYFAKYAQKGQVKLEWSGATAEGITLETLAHTDLGDSIALSGQANCPVGTYNYAVVTYFGGKETGRAKGKFSVISDIKATSDLIVNAYTGEEMEQITFKYYALSADDVKVTWPNGKPDGIDGKGNNGIYTIGGTPTAAGEYPFSVTVTGSETVLEGKIKIQTIDIGSNAVLYLYKTNGAEEKDQIFSYLKTQNWNPIARKTIDDLRDPDQYGKYQWIFISEDADSDNPEVLALIKGGSSLPIFSVNGFTYTKDRLDWGEPDNGALTEEALSLTVQRDDHPIFKKLGKKQGSKVQVLSNENLGKKGLMPIRVKLPGTHCLATAWTRDINDYNGNGEEQTIIHEIPAKMRGGQKYVCLPIATSSTANLTSDGKQLINAIINYLIDESVSPVFLPTLQINRFTLEGFEGVIDQANYTIEVEMTDEQFNELDSLRAAKPVITLADPTYSHVVPSVDKEQDFRFSSFIPVVYTVTDYINRLPYAVSLRIKNTQGIDEVYTVGEWVNIFDVYGRKVATTNEDIHAMPLPNGMYIVVTESGQTLKIMR